MRHKSVVISRTGHVSIREDNSLLKRGKKKIWIEEGIELEEEADMERQNETKQDKDRTENIWGTLEASQKS